MKKFILIMFAVLMTAVVVGQDDTFSFRKITDTYASVSPAATITDGDSIYIADCYVERNFPYVIDAYASIDSLKYVTNDTIFCKMQGKIFSGQNWTDIDTVKLTLPAATNKVTWTLTSAIYRYRYIRFYFHSKDSDTNWRVNSIELKVNPASLTDEVN